MSVADFHEQHILFLKGVSLSNFVSIEDKFNQDLLLVDQPSRSIQETMWDKIPQHFTGMDDWIKSTNLRCWYCSMKFKSSPWFIILYCNRTHTQPIYDITGNFCSCGCLLGYINLHYNKRENFDIYQNVFKLYEIMYHKHIDDIEIPKNKYNLKMYGGDMTIDEYKKHLQSVNDTNMHNGVSL